MTRLSEVAEIIMGQSPPGNSYNKNGEGLPLLNGAADFDGVNICPVQYSTKPRKISKKGDILLCIRATIGNVTISDEEYCLGRGVAAIRVTDDKVNTSYLSKMLEGKIERLVYSAKGSTIKGIKKKDLEALQFFFPSLQSQNKVVSILEKAKQLKQLRKEADKLTEDYLNSVFLEMFGNPYMNDKKFRTENFLDVFDVTTGKLDSNAAEKNGRYPFFTCAQETFKINKYSFDCEALILSGNNATGIFSVKYYNGKFDAYQRTYVLTLKDNNHSYRYLQFLLEKKLDELQFRSIGTNTKYLTLRILKTIDLISPPIELQNDFSRIVENVEKLKASQKRSERKIDELNSFLMQKAFRGELTC